ncbi:glycerol dehydratase reactivase beta/small subunit family protein [Streptococcus panodentis]|uniref:PduH protein n=1 Tax=Streptococcus panodentis TaxID=1581472 RepID=A0ABS5AXK8_9STRE|nr:glycerol dehydratase reactivase beta/small subunit family protein [Streptococcus panodentis]MBP2621312.1 PduH protein [Streptococcus panodentis]
MEFHYTSKPTILLLVKGQPHEAKLAQIAYGIEEEGIPFQRILPEKTANLVSLAHQAALQSQLLVGIACDEQDTVLHYRNLPEEKFVYRIRDYTAASDKELRLFGSNAARLVKGVPFRKSPALEVSF